MLDQDTFINMLNMMYSTVSIISKKNGIYITHDKSKSYLIINKDDININEEIKTSHIGSSWISVTKLDNTLYIINKNTKDIMASYTDVDRSFKQNIFDDKCSILHIVTNSSPNVVRFIIINNNEAKILYDIENVRKSTIDEFGCLVFEIIKNEDTISYILNKNLEIKRNYRKILFY